MTHLINTVWYNEVDEHEADNRGIDDNDVILRRLLALEQTAQASVNNNLGAISKHGCFILNSICFIGERVNSCFH